LSDFNTSCAWRYIDSAVSTGPVNMAIDESLLCLFDYEVSEPILRTYGWDPPTLSLGRFQKTDDVLDLDRCSRYGVSVVRRISGGATIYHVDELTYCIVCSPEHIQSANSVKDSFRVLTGFLLEFYRSIGLNASYALDSVSIAERLGERTAFCFAGKESFDILINGKKIGGNAQRRHKRVIFQHGSIPIMNRARYGLQYMKDRSPEYADNTISLFDCGITSDVTTLKRLLVDAFINQMGVQARPSELSAGEQEMSRSLLATKYTSESWNLQGIAP